MIITLSTHNTEQYCLDMPSSIEFHKFLSSTAENYEEFVGKAKGLLKDYFQKQSIPTDIATTIYEDLHMSPQGFLQLQNADLSFNCTEKDIEVLQQNMNDILKPITPEKMRTATNWSNLPLQKYPVLGKF